MKKNKAIKKALLRVISAVLLAATVCMCFASCAAGDKIKEAWGKVLDGADDLKNDITGATAAVDPLQIDFGSPENIVMTAVASGSIEASDTQPAQVYKVIKATVSPESATDKSTLWDVYWIDNQMGEDAVVTDYVMVDPCCGWLGTEEGYNTHQDGSNYCKVACLQPFSGTVGVKVTTAVGGYTAECQVTYVGEPTYLGFHRVLEDGSYQHVGSDTPFLNSGSTVLFKLALNNVFHDVGSDYGQYKIVDKGAVGFFNVIATPSNTGVSSDVCVSADEFFRGELFLSAVNINNDYLAVQTIEFSKYSLDRSAEYGGTPYTIHESYLSGIENVTFYVTVLDTVSGVKNTLNFKLTDVDSVALSDSTLTF